MSKARNRSLFIRLRLVLAAEPELRLAVYLRTKRAELNHHGPFAEASQESGRLMSCMPSCQTVSQINNTKRHRLNLYPSENNKEKTEETVGDN